MLDRILGIWATVTGISLLFTFFWQYRARTRYLYLFFFGGASLMWGIVLLAKIPLFPLWLRWLLFACGLATMLMDSVRRYRETFRRIRAEQVQRRGRNLESSDPENPTDV